MNITVQPVDGIIPIGEAVTVFVSTGLRGPAGADSTVPGPAGADGPAGDPGEGVPVGGTAGQGLVKLSGTNYDTAWDDVILEGDSRLTDSRTPATHAATHASAGTDPVTLAQAQVTGLVASLAAKLASADLPASVLALALTDFPAGLARDSEVTAAVAALVDAAPGALDTLNELAAALGDDPNFATTITNALALKADDADVMHLTGDETAAGYKTFDDGLASSEAYVSGGGRYVYALPGTIEAGVESSSDFSRWVGGSASGPPDSGSVGDWLVSQDGHIWICTVAGTPGTWVDVGAGGGSGNGLPANIVNASSAVTAVVGDFVQGDTTSAGFTVTLPSNPAVGGLVTVKRVAGSNTLTVDPTGAGTVDGDATATIVGDWAGAVFEHVGSDVWRIVAVMSAGGGVSSVNGYTGAVVLSASDLTTGTLPDAQIPSTIARDSEVTTAVSDHSTDTTAVHGIADTAALALDANVVHDTGTETIAGAKTFSDEVIVQGGVNAQGGTGSSYVFHDGDGVEVAAISGQFARWRGATASGAPASGAYLVGDWILALDTGHLWICTAAGSPGTWLDSGAAAFARANHTGTQTASTVSDFSEAVDDRVATLIVAGTNITKTYDDGAGTLTLDAAGGSGIPASTVDAKGDLLVATAADTVTRLAVGATNDHVLTVDSAEATGVKWAAAAGGGGGGGLTPTAIKTAAYTAAASELVRADTTTGWTLTLPDTHTNGQQVGFIKTTSDANTLTIDGGSTDTINGDLTATLTEQYAGAILTSDGTNWLITGTF